MDAKGARSTTPAGKALLACALEACGTSAAKKAAEKCAREKKFRFAYAGHVKQLVTHGAASPAAALESSKAGLGWLRANFEFVDSGGVAQPFEKAVAKGSQATTSNRSLASVRVAGRGAVSSTQTYEVPYDGGWHPSSPAAPAAGKSGGDLEQLCASWVQKGIVEPDAAEAINWTSRYVDAGGRLDDCHFVLIGAGSAMGPCAKLLELGAHVVAIDIPGSWGKGGKRPASSLWARLIALADASPGGSLTAPVSAADAAAAQTLADQARQGGKKLTSLSAPSSELGELCGCDLMNEPREIAEWLEHVWLPTLPKSARVCVGNYTYLDGELHVKLALCADLIIERVLKASKELKFKTPAACAFLCTPTDAHVCTPAAHAAAKQAYGSGLGSFGLEKLFHCVTGGSKLVRNFGRAIACDDGSQVHVCDGLSVAQGPNYAIAKRIQHWRACCAFEAGHTASSMVAPSTATISVIHNKTFAWAYGGMPYFGFEIFKQETTNAVMCAVLLHDVLNDGGPKAPANRAKFGIKNSLQLFSTESVHGGLWRSPYTVDSIGEVCALIYFAGVLKPYAAGTLVLAASAYVALNCM